MIDTPLRAAARMLLRMRDRACHHDDAKHLLTTAYAAADLAATLSPAEAIRVLDDVEATGPAGMSPEERADWIAAEDGAG